VRRTLFQIILILLFTCSVVAIYSEVYLGVYLLEYDNEKTNNKELPEHGLKVHNVIKDSPADEAKLEEGDIILEVENHKLAKIDQLIDILKGYKTGDSVKVTYFRNNKTYSTRLKLADKVESELNTFQDRIEDLLDQSKTFIFRIESGDDNVIGVEISPVNRDKNRPGAVITKVIPNSPAEKAKLQQDDVIIRIAGKDIRNSVDVINAIQTSEAGDTIKIEFYRNDQKMEAQVEIVKRKSIFK
jgi:S1-C subfamily serine protease